MKRYFLALMLVALSPVPALAADLPMADPTQPPMGLLGPDGMPLVDVTNSGLTSVMMPKKGKAAAIIGGQVVRIGDMVGEARLTRISETGVVLEGPNGIERLYLTPDVDKKTKVTRAAVRRNKE